MEHLEDRRSGLPTALDFKNTFRMFFSKGELYMKWLRLIMEYLMTTLDKFSKIGEDVILKYPKLIQHFNQRSDSELVSFIIKANIIKSKSGRVQIQVLTANGWDCLDDLFLDELRNLLGANCLDVDLDNAGEIVSSFQESLNICLNKVKTVFVKSTTKPLK